jgi:NAD(P)-dependent dehydrogenase (short-subunit alcohol dehydrogenase family)
MDLRLQGQKALITGASRGIGRAIAAELVREGASVALCARQAEALDQARAQLATLGPGVVFTQTADLADTAQVRGFVTAAVDALGGLDIFIHNASAMTGPGSGEEGWRQTLAVDILAGVVGAETALAALERSTAASVVFIGSTASMEFFNGPRPYGAGKAAMRTYARELGEVWGRKGIRVNVVSLGSIDFPGSVWDRVKAGDPERYARVLHTMPLGRYGSAEEAARAVVFVASPAASWINGTNVVVDGGQHKGVD